jgi:potassium uptake TrkH family protein
MTDICRIMFESIKSFREAVNIKLYGSKKQMATVLNYFSALVSLVVLSSLVYYYGYPAERVNRNVILGLIHFSLGFYVLKYVVGYVYSFQPMTYFRETWREGIAIALIAINGLSILFFNLNIVVWLGSQWEVKWFNDFIIGFIQIYLLYLVSLEIGKSTTVFNRISISPPVFFVLSLFSLIIIGSLLLMLPEMNANGEGVFFDALFTSISASCLTGLSVIDIGDVYSLKGQVVIMILIQLGGLNIIAFATMLAFLARNGIGLKFQSVLQSSVLADSPENSRKVFKQMLGFVFVFELAGVALIFLSVDGVDAFKSGSERLFFSVFHSISAFNNAGFSTLPDGLADVSVSGLMSLQGTIAVLIILGSLGFSNLGDIVTTGYQRRIKKERWRKFRIDTKISLYATFALLITAFVLIFTLEYDQALDGMSAGKKLMASFFQSVTLRSAGFNTIDFGSLSTALVVAMIFYMFIGGAPGSTSGGIKTNTFALLLVVGYSIIRGKPRLELFRYTISTELMKRAIAIFLFTLTGITVGIFILALLEPNIPFVDLMFEQVSALCNVGLSRGITAELSPLARITIMASMIIGRVGVLTLAFALLKPKKYKNYKYPSAHITVG